MNELYLPFAMAALVLLASLLSIRFALSVAIVEIALGVVGGNLLHMHTTAWIDFLAGAEVDTDLLREKLKESVLIGGLSFLLPFVAAFLYLFFVAGWSLKAARSAALHCPPPPSRSSMPSWWRLVSRPRPRGRFSWRHALSPILGRSSR